MNIYQLPEDTTFERIRQHLLTGYEISAVDKNQLDRWRAVQALLLEKKTDRQIALMHSKNYDISLGHAYIDIRNSKNLLGDVHKADKESLRYMVTQWAIEACKKAEETGDNDTLVKSLEKIIKANNLDKEDQDLPDPSKIQPPVQLLSINFNFINSPWFKKIDPKAQEGLMLMYNQFMAMIENSPLRDYANLIQSNSYQLPPEDGD
jgi:hypothetical protein